MKRVKYFIFLNLIISFQAIGVITEDFWNFTHNIYLATPVYIYTEESVITNRGGSLEEITGKILGKPSKQQLFSKTVHYYFKIDEVLYGKEESMFHIQFKYDDEYKTCDLNNNFNNQNEKTFWETQVGRSIFNNHSIHSCFELNKQYLIIGNNQLDRKQYELINSPDDKWLNHVKEKIKTLVPLESRESNGVNNLRIDN